MNVDGEAPAGCTAAEDEMHQCAGRYICPFYGGPPDDPDHESVWAEFGSCRCKGCQVAKQRVADEFNARYPRKGRT